MRSIDSITRCHGAQGDPATKGLSDPDMKQRGCSLSSGDVAMVRRENLRLRGSYGHETAASPTFCSETAHEQLRSSDAWQSMPYVGIQPGVAGIPALEMRNCAECHSTLCREVVP